MFPHIFPFSGIPPEAGLDMTAAFLPLLIGLVVLLGVCILGLAVEGIHSAWARHTTVELVGKRFVCPVKGKEVEVAFLAWKKEPENFLGVAHCSAFQEEDQIDCDKGCLHLPRARAAAPLFHHSLPFLHAAH